MAEVAARAGAVLGRELRYEEETLEEAYASRRATYPDAADWQLDAWVSTYTSIADGSVGDVSGDIERLLGRPARTLEEALTGDRR
jgi:NAD(P)H dehydrogenase (quinone)